MIFLTLVIPEKAETFKFHPKIFYKLLLSYIIFLTLVIPVSNFRSYCYNPSSKTNSIYESNLKTVLKSLSTDTQITYGYYNFSVGEDPDKVGAMALCRSDIHVDDCRLCVQFTVSELTKRCGLNHTMVFGYSDNCDIYYTNSTIFHSLNIRPRLPIWSDKDVSSITVFNSTLLKLLSRLQKQASLGDSQTKFATGQMNLNPNSSLYGMVQCSPDLSSHQCIQCVQKISSYINEHFITSNLTSAGARSITPSCNFRYEMYRFYGNVSDAATPPAPPPSAGADRSNASKQDGKIKKSRSIAAIISPVAIVGAIIMTAVIFLLVMKKRGHSSTKFNQEYIETLSSLQYTLGVLKVATDYFSEANKLGAGGFGIVYKGKLADGQEVAVKRLMENATQGNKQFKNEILTLAKLYHRNLVRLLGFCLEDEEMLLVYEFVINSSLDHFIHDPLKRASLQWEIRRKIITGISRGLLYLHEDSRLRIIHRDLKAGNVLLDADYNPKIADFGMARLFKFDQTQSVASKVCGTYGYMAPEYVLHGQVSLRSDVFSFGVLVLEIISGQTIGHFQGENQENLLTFAWHNWIEGKAWNLVDPTLSGASTTEILRCIHIGLLCVQHNVTDRPRMSGVTLMLSSESVTLQVPSQPAFFSRDDTRESTSGRLINKTPVTYSINEVTMTQMYPR